MKSTPNRVGTSMRSSAIAAAVSLAFASSTLAAYHLDFTDINGNVYATIRVMQPSDRETLAESYRNYLGDADIRELNEDDRVSLQVAINYFSDILGSAVFVPTVDLIPTTIRSSNAAADTNRDATLDNRSEFLNAVAGKKDYGDKSTAFILFDMPRSGSDWIAAPLSVLTQNGNVTQLSGLVMHEFVHAYGMQKLIGLNADGAFQWSSPIAPYDQGLRDVFGNPAGTDQTIQVIYRPENGEWTEAFIHSNKKDGAFNVLAGPGLVSSSVELSDPTNVFVSGLSFAGSHVQTLLGKDTSIYYADLPIVDGNELITRTMLNSVTGGIPIRAVEAVGLTPYENDFQVTYQIDFSHIELQNSALSHQTWRNWGTLMEAELALLQDLGFEFDRKRFFGTSIYASGQTERITQAFTQREGHRWLVDTASTQSLAVGTHIYGSLNTVTVAADQLADGLGAIGVRVDGVKNTLSVEEGYKVSANGQGGLGVAFTYGRNHTFNLAQGASIEANGVGGRALSFDFGSNMLGDYTEYRGSLMNGALIAQDQWGHSENMLDALNDALVDNVVIEGNVSATGDGGKAIYIAPNAWVKRIEIASRANVTGDIVSMRNAQADIVTRSDEKDYYRAEHPDYPGLYAFAEKSNDVDLSTNLVLNGATYYGNILGADGIRITVGPTSDIVTADAGKTATFTGLAQVLGVNIRSGATLTGGGTFILTPPKNDTTYARVTDQSFKQQTFVNDGKLISSPATGTTYIVGNYKQNAGASLVVGIDSQSRLSGLVVSGTASFAETAPTIGLIPALDYYGA